MQEVLSEFLFSEEKDSGVILYVDDIFGYACSIKDLGELAVKVVNKLHSSRLKLNKEKSRLFATNIDFLSFEFGQREIRPSSDYIKKIMNLKFRQILHKECFNHINSLKCIQAFNKVNKQLSSRPVIAPPIFGLPFELMVDSCKDAVGAILFQMQEGEKKVIGYFSKRFKE
uniref:Reverse transcriptase domain-containing protein n=1 Tax=Strongyloides venezuelensis TaxID=75913 RepID=A0A0K0FQ66_STRVS